MRKGFVVFPVAGAVVAAIAWVAPAAQAVTGTSVRVNVANPASPFPPNKSAEAAVAINPVAPSMVAASAFDETDEAPCGTPAALAGGGVCGFAPGVGTTGAYFSFDSGHHWIQPAFTGLTARSGTVHFGTIHTLPWYFESGLVSDADSAVAFGPRPVNGHFSWTNGVRAYFGNLTSNLNAKKSETFKGFESVAVSRIDNPTPGRVGVKSNWFRPVIAVTHQSSTAFEDKDQIWADNASSSPFFGHVYACFAEFRGLGHFQNGNEPAPLVVAASTDGGTTWSKKQLNPAATTPQSQQGFGTSGCTIRTTSTGVVDLFAFVFSAGTPGTGFHVLFQSFDGGKSWTRPRRLFPVNNGCFFIDPVEGRCVSDGIAGSRIDLSPAPSVDIANGAPTGKDATNEIVDSWVDGRFGFNHEKVLFSFSTNGAKTWSSPQIVPGPGRGFYSAPAISPNGKTVFEANSWLLAPFQNNTTNPRPEVNTLQQSAIGANGAPTGWSMPVVGAVGDLRAASANGLAFEFSGDYNYASAARTFGIGVWTADARDATHCAAIDAWRASLFTATPLPQPNPATACPGRFGNINIFAGTTG